MESENRGLDLEKELTCSICTELLYQPLTLLDCLHTFCGSCLKEWFTWQLASSSNAPNPPPPGTNPYTCPSCRATVRDTKHNATVTTLLDMFLAANPDKGKTVEEKETMREKYKPGDEVLPKIDTREKTLRERRIDDADRRLMEEVRTLSLQEAGVESSEARRERRRREDGRSQGSRPRSSRDTSNGRSGDDAERRRRRAEDHERRRTRDDVALRSDAAGSGDDRRHRRSDAEARRRQEETSRTAARHVEHQSSLRSLISSSDIDSQEMEEEILRQIREEGLLDGIDLENIDVSQEDQISERIADAFRRRQLERSRAEPVRSSRTSGRREQVTPAAESRETSGDDARTSRRRRTHSQSPSTTNTGDELSRPPPAMSAAHATHLDIQSGEQGRRRRRTISSSRSATAPVSVSEVEEARPAARSQTDLVDRSHSSHSVSTRPLVTEKSRSNTEPAQEQPTELITSSQELRPIPRSSPRVRPVSALVPHDSHPLSHIPSRGHVPARSEDISAAITNSGSTNRAPPPANINVPLSNSSGQEQLSMEPNLFPAPLSPRRTTTLSDRANAMSSASRPTSSSSSTSKVRSQLYPEPSLTCAKCSKPHIEYELHYNCAICFNGLYNICLPCYRQGLGCLHWFGFGYAAWTKWEKLNQLNELAPDADRPHMLTANRYIPPKSTPGGADGRKTLTTDDPQRRLQSGAFCANCLAWANECFWRCDVCNEGDWGFCNLCVNQGRSCTHALLPLTYKPSESYTPPLSPTHDQETPASASILTGPGVIDVGPFKPLTFSTKCDICHCPIHPTSLRYHCYHCVSKVPNTQPGDYDICTACYSKLIASRRIGAENGQNGWRRCLQGHRMVIVGFEDKRGGQRRSVVHDLVGGRGLRQEPCIITDHSGGELQKWSWEEGKHTRLVTTDVMKTAPTTSPGLTIETSFPPNGGIGMTALAIWSWPYATKGEIADDELLFPKGAEIRECMVANEEWYHGSYMGKTGLFPAPYVRVLDRSRT